MFNGGRALPELTPEALCQGLSARLAVPAPEGVGFPAGSTGCAVNFQRRNSRERSDPNRQFSDSNLTR